jgi:hypothetical protein
MTRVDLERCFQRLFPKMSVRAVIARYEFLKAVLGLCSWFGIGLILMVFPKPGGGDGTLLTLLGLWAAVHFVSGIGLSRGRLWADYLAIVTNGFLALAAAYELAAQPNVAWAVVFLGSAAAVWYLVKQIRHSPNLPKPM